MSALFRLLVIAMVGFWTAPCLGAAGLAVHEILSHHHESGGGHSHPHDGHHGHHHHDDHDHDPPSLIEAPAPPVRSGNPEGLVALESLPRVPETPAAVLTGSRFPPRTCPENGTDLPVLLCSLLI